MDKKTPEQIKNLAHDWEDRSWENYSIHELGMWIHLLLKRSVHRTDPQKALKDIQDAINYNSMILSHIEYQQKLVASRIEHE